MRVTHTIQLVLAAVAAGAGALLPFADGPITLPKGLMGAAAVALAVKGALSVASEVQGDKAGGGS